MDALLLAGYRSIFPVPLGLEKDVLGTHLLDNQIARLKAIGLSPIVVLAGENADLVIRSSRQLEDCELVYDTNGHEANILSNIRSGLRATEEACFVLPVEIPMPAESHWRHLKAELIHEGFLTKIHIFQVGAKGAPWHFGFPILISAVGRRALLGLENPTGLSDRRLAYHFSRLALALESHSL